MEPLVLRCRILAPYVPLRATSSESVPCVDIVDIAQPDFENREFRNYLEQTKKVRRYDNVKKYIDRKEITNTIYSYTFDICRD